MFLNTRIPVIYKKIPLMPMKLKRCIKYEKEGKGKFRFNNKLRIRYFELLEEPSGYDLQPLNLGIDPGSHFDGFSITSKFCHHHNFQLNHNKNIKELMIRRSMYRRLRRSRLRHRPIRFDSRTSKKLSPTINSMVEFRKWIINQILSLYPIKRVIVENVKYNHYGDKSGKGNSFSQAEQGKNKLYNWIKEQNIKLFKIKGYLTKKLRIKIFGFDPKLKDKGSKDFNAHSIDSFVISTLLLKNIPRIHKKLIDITKVFYIRRYLYQFKKLYKDKKYYFRYLKGSIKKFFTKMSKVSICRVKLEGDQSNHPKAWKYINNGKVECFKHFKSLNGGTRKFGISKYMIFKDLLKNEIFQVHDINKCKIISDNLNIFKLIEYKNRIIEIY